MRDRNITLEAYRYDPDSERELDRRGVVIALLISTLFWLGVGAYVWSWL